MSDETKTKAPNKLGNKTVELPEDDKAALDLLPELRDALAKDPELRKTFDLYRTTGAAAVRTLAMVALNAMTDKVGPPKTAEMAPAAALTQSIAALAAANVLTHLFQNLVPEKLAKDTVLMQLVGFIAGREGERIWEKVSEHASEEEKTLQEIKEAIYGPSGKPTA